MARSDWKRPALVPIEAGKRRIKMILSYDGTPYSGWAYQTNAPTVVGVLQQTILEMIDEEVEVIGSGRTDSGVHAAAQVCHFDIAHRNIKSGKFKPALNRLLPQSIRILHSEEVDGSFHARYTTMGRTYRYYFKREGELLGFDEHRVAKLKAFPSLPLLDGYAKILVGTHDFTTFAAASDNSESKVRDIYESYWKIEKDRFGAELLTYTISGNAFLHKMIRSLVGSMIQFAGQKMGVEEFVGILEAKDRFRAGRTAQACGLYLYRITYDEEEYAWFEEEYGGH
ncbi:MAG TPA: tRNA pseudouridine(38-40) synthase TruA [Sphaerochaeta sp.]|jgi:tRNA pseudouridine38-40 synthase|nr:tRNA pseudouridine(38-40) synthase TruA [Spirochaetota bacterium]NLL25185.1 tRNA pseudouridine(38-40) synthase TruA [Spirochaetales bacterium]TAH57194.1 MAG: tRNA pseudouridine(38-40) synthase TruA [Sphaerochaeta sp.]HOE89536.1 tRNA pseudouridine(38-40) synthase TruA [Sphaerochaeta sp.]HOR79950.1 tRNA pseudouridine(38-40) synthase TruA [Sphaerochaeta sp.]